jgi:hypothetical protein
VCFLLPALILLVSQCSGFGFGAFLTPGPGSDGSALRKISWIRNDFHYLHSFIFPLQNPQTQIQGVRTPARMQKFLKRATEPGFGMPAENAGRSRTSPAA